MLVVQKVKIKLVTISNFSQVCCSLVLAGNNGPLCQKHIALVYSYMARPCLTSWYS